MGGFKWSSQRPDREGLQMGSWQECAAAAQSTHRRSPGRPTTTGGREARRRFWGAIARGVTSELAGVEAGVSSAIATRWFREAGGMAPISLAPVSGRYLSFAEREEIAILLAQQLGVREIARQLGRSPSTISREVRRNHAFRGGYRATNAQWHAERRARRPKPAKLAINDALRGYVQDRLAGVITRPDGSKVPGPSVVWNGRDRGHQRHRRRDRRWATAWSPAQIAHRLPIDFPDDESMRLSHEAIYRALYVQGRGALRRELTACLRTGRALRVPRARQRSGKPFVSPEIMISERPAEVEDRAVPGHWEGDLILGIGSSAIGTLVERSTRFTMLLHLPRMPDHGQPATPNGPALAGHGAEAVRTAIAATITTLPVQLRRSLTWDQGSELSQHAQLRIDTGLAIYFCDPRSPWQRGTNENTNGLLRQYFPKGTDLSRHSPDDLRRSRSSPQRSPPKNPGLENTGRSSQRPATLSQPRRCCDDPLNLGFDHRSEFAVGVITEL
jgi:IS30 family transposase